MKKKKDRQKEIKKDRESSAKNRDKGRHEPSQTKLNHTKSCQICSIETKKNVCFSGPISFESECNSQCSEMHSKTEFSSSIDLIVLFFIHTWEFTFQKTLLVTLNAANNNATRLRYVQ